MYRTVFWTLWERFKVGWFGRMALKHVYYHMWNGSPVQVQCMIQGAQGWCTGMTQRDGMGREVGGGFRVRNTCTPVADSCQCMAKPIQYCKVIQFSSIQLLNRVQLFETPWIAARQASLSITNSQRLHKLMSIESVMPLSHLILCRPLLLLPSLWVIPVHQPWAPCIMHRTWTGDSLHIWYFTCFNAILPNHPTLALSHRVQKTVLYICVSFAILHTGLSLPSF